MYQNNNELFRFINNSPTCFHAVKSICDYLENAGCERLYENKKWHISLGGKYFVTRNDSSVIAFSVGEDLENYSFNITASHSDSPSFKVKEVPVISGGSLYTRLNTEKYGGAILSTWFDKPLSLAGRVSLKNGNTIENKLINFNRDLLLIPNVAIHFNREINEGYKYNAQVDTVPLLSCDGNNSELLYDLISEELGVEKENISSTELFLYNRTAPTQWGAKGEFISAPRLDDLQCAFATLKGFLNGKSHRSVNVYCCFDNEEVGSSTKQGAGSTFFKDILSRISLALGKSSEEHLCALANSFMISADNAHAVHPNHPELTDSDNFVKLNNGPAVKVNASQSYATDSLTSAGFKLMCEKCGVPVQSFSNRSDQRGGSTLGNIASGSVSIRMVDVGLPQLSMHSCYETAGADDTDYLIKVVTEFYNSYIYEDNGNLIIS